MTTVCMLEKVVSDKQIEERLIENGLPITPDAIRKVRRHLCGVAMQWAWDEWEQLDDPDFVDIVNAPED